MSLFEYIVAVIDRYLIQVGAAGGRIAGFIQAIPVGQVTAPGLPVINQRTHLATLHIKNIQGYIRRGRNFISDLR